MVRSDCDATETAGSIMIISRTPFRISFFGGGTDFPEFYRVHGGATLLTTIDQYCYITIHRLAPFFKYRFKASYARTETVQSAQEFKHPLIRECLTHLDIKEGLEIAHVADLPGRTGIGSSSSFTVGLLNVLHALRHDRVTAEDLAKESIHVERVLVKDIGGHQDQYAAAYGGLMRLNFNPDGRVTSQLLSLPSERIRAVESCLMLFFMGTEQSSKAILVEQQKRTSQNVAVLQEMKAMVQTAETILMSHQPIANFGRLLHDSWQLKKTLSNGISNPDIDEAYAIARRAGALGGKLLGAGGRGFLLLFAMPEAQAVIRQQLKHFQEVPFAFSTKGSEIIFESSR